MDMLYFMSYLKFSNINCKGYHFTNSNMFGSLRKEKRIKKRRTNDNLTIATSHFVFMIFFFWIPAKEDTKFIKLQKIRMNPSMM